MAEVYTCSTCRRPKEVAISSVVTGSAPMEAAAIWLTSSMPDILAGTALARELAEEEEEQ